MVRLCYLVCATPRTGSSLLCKALWASGRAGRPKESFGTTRLELDGRPETKLEDLAAAVFMESATSNGVGGAKIMWDHLRRFASDGSQEPNCTQLRAFAKALPPVRYIWLHRRDKVRQAISFVRAEQSGRWDSTQESNSANERFDRRAVDSRLQELRRSDESWRRYFDCLGVEPLEIVYEEMAADIAATLRAAFDFLEVPAAPLPPIELRRQADETTERWVDRYRNPPLLDRLRMLATRRSR